MSSSIRIGRRNAALACWALSAVVLLVVITSTAITTTTDNRPLNINFGIIHHIDRRLNTLLDEDQTLPPIFPFRWPQDYLGFGCAILGLLLAAGGGIGGGGILVPVYILLLEFPVKHAIPLASVTVLGGAIANTVLNIRKVHPDHPERPAIDWDLILLLQPATIAGALIGADLNEELPEIVLLVLMLLLLSVTAYKTLGKACKMYREEEEKLKFAWPECACASNLSSQQVESEFGDFAAIAMEGAVSRPKLEVDVDHYGLHEDNGAIIQLQEPKLEPNGERLTKERNDMHHGTNNIEANSIVNDAQYTPSKYETDRLAIKRQCINDAIKLVSLFSIVTLLDLLRGTPDGSEGGSPIALDNCGEYCYYFSASLMFLCIALFSNYVRCSILERQELCGPVISEIHWDNRNTVIYPSLSIIAGLVAGMFGIGGGIIKGPLMIALGVHPQVASATSACMILFTSSTSTICYLISGYLVYDYAAFCLLLGFASTVVGQTAMSALLESSGKRSSYIAFCIGGVVAISAVAMGIESVVAIFYS